MLHEFAFYLVAMFLVSQGMSELVVNGAILNLLCCIKLNPKNASRKKTPLVVGHNIIEDRKTKLKSDVLRRVR